MYTESVFPLKGRTFRAEVPHWVTLTVLGKGVFVTGAAAFNGRRGVKERLAERFEGVTEEWLASQKLLFQ